MLTRTMGIMGLTLTLCWGCADKSDDVGSPYVKAVSVAAAQGATIDVATQDSPELAGTRLVIPGRALASDGRITLELQSQTIIRGQGESVGPVAVWGPSGTTFAGGATLTLPFHLGAGQSEKDLFVQVLEADNTQRTFGRSDLTVDMNAGLVTLAIPGFSAYQAGVLCTATNCPSRTATGSGTNSGTATGSGTNSGTATGSGTNSGGTGKTAAGNP